MGNSGIPGISGNQEHHGIMFNSSEEQDAFYSKMKNERLEWDDPNLFSWLLERRKKDTSDFGWVNKFEDGKSLRTKAL